MPRESLTINKTEDYDQFSFIDSNRQQSRGHIENVKKAFEDYGNLTRVQPILVNDQMEIIDGQHRFTACVELGEPVYYTIAPGLGVAEARSMNILHKGWGPLDYARSYANQGNSNYSRLLWLINEYGFAATTTIVYAVGSEPRGIFKQFREGDFTFPEAAYEVAKERLDKLHDVSELVTFGKEKRFATAFMKAMQVEGYDHTRMIRKLEIHQNLLERKATPEDYLRLLEDIYNHQMSESRRLRLY